MEFDMLHEPEISRIDRRTISVTCPACGAQLTAAGNGDHDIEVVEFAFDQGCDAYVTRCRRFDRISKKSPR